MYHGKEYQEEACEVYYGVYSESNDQLICEDENCLDLSQKERVKDLGSGDDAIEEGDRSLALVPLTVIQELEDLLLERNERSKYRLLLLKG